MTAPVPARTTLPGHHRPRGGFRSPWPVARRANAMASLLRWVLVERTLLRSRRPDPPATAFARAEPSFARPRAAGDEVTATWVGHSSFLLQLGGWNVLTDPAWSERASPLSWAGPRRHTAPGLALEQLPPVDAVLLSHDHYDHLDLPTVRRLAGRFPDAHWVAPLGNGPRLRRCGARHVEERDWWERATLAPRAGHAPGTGALELTCVPAQHFSGRGLRDRDRTLWCGWAARTGAAAAYFVGDTGDHPLWTEIGRRLGPLDLVLMPIGAYDPRWFMRSVHVNPEEAVAAFAALCAGGADGGSAPAMIAMHWGTFKLTDEPLDEPPGRTRAAWARHALPDDRLWVLAHGETRGRPARSGGQVGT